MFITIARLKNGECVALSNAISTSFFKNSKESVKKIINQFPYDWENRLSLLGVVPNWNSQNTINTLNNYLKSSDCHTIILTSRFTGQKFCVGKSEVVGFELQDDFSWGRQWGIL